MKEVQDLLNIQRQDQGTSVAKRVVSWQNEVILKEVIPVMPVKAQGQIKKVLLNAAVAEECDKDSF
jgi:hypothetical protein